MSIPEKTIIACGPVIIEKGKVLLNREAKDYGTSPWLFSGGKMEDLDAGFEETCIREVKEEMGIDIEIIRPLKPMIVSRPEDKTQKAILIHYLAK